MQKMKLDTLATRPKRDLDFMLDECVRVYSFDRKDQDIE